MSKVLVIGDLHLPAERKDYLAFCKSIKRKYRTDTTIFIGDIVDQHAVSFHKKHPDSPSAVQEYESAMQSLKDWKKAFPEAMVCIGNHDERIKRVGEASGIPSMYFKDYKDVFDTPLWDWDYEFVVDDISYLHGTGATSGICPAFGNARVRGQSTVSGHLHATAGICWQAGPNDTKIFGFNVPNGVDKEHLFMYYSKNFLRKPINGVGVVIDGKPYMEILD